MLVVAEAIPQLACGQRKGHDGRDKQNGPQGIVHCGGSHDGSSGTRQKGVVRRRGRWRQPVRLRLQLGSHSGEQLVDGRRRVVQELHASGPQVVQGIVAPLRADEQEVQLVR